MVNSGNASKGGMSIMGGFVKGILAALAVGATWFYGLPSNSLLTSVLLVLLFSVIIQTLANSKERGKYIIQFMIYVLLIAALYSVAPQMGADSGIAISFALWFVLVSEVACIMVAANAAGIPIPAQAIQFLTQLGVIPAGIMQAVEATPTGQELLALEQPTATAPATAPAPTTTATVVSTPVGMTPEVLAAISSAVAAAVTAIPTLNS